MHESVLLRESLEALDLQANGIYVDATFGRGGHSSEILKRLGPAGRLIAFDRDPQAIAVAHEKFANEARFSIVQNAFSHLQTTVEGLGLSGKINGILMDLGVSSPQLDEAERGFSFMRDGELDMRMDPTRGQSAAAYIATVKEEDLADVIYRLGEDRQSRRIAKAIVNARALKPITRTLELAQIVADAIPRKEKHKHPATRTFLALRLKVNDELGEVERTLPQAMNVLADKGRLVVISFHSLEDRIVKLFMRDEARGPRLPKDIPILDADVHRRLRLIDKIMPSEEETRINPRARSAVLRVAERRL